MPVYRIHRAEIDRVLRRLERSGETVISKETDHTNNHYLRVVTNKVTPNETRDAS